MCFCPCNTEKGHVETQFYNTELRQKQQNQTEPVTNSWKLSLGLIQILLFSRLKRPPKVSMEISTFGAKEMSTNGREAGLLADAMCHRWRPTQGFICVCNTKLRKS